MAGGGGGRAGTVEHGYRVERRVGWVGGCQGGLRWMGSGREEEVEVEEEEVERTEYVEDCGGSARRGE